MTQLTLFKLETRLHAGSAGSEQLARRQVRDFAEKLHAYSSGFHSQSAPVISTRSYPHSSAQESALRIGLDALQVAVDQCSVWAHKAQSKELDNRSDYSLLRTILEALFTAIWVLGPAEPESRALRSLQLRKAELRELALYLARLEKLDPGGDRLRRKELAAALDTLQADYLASCGSSGLAAGTVRTISAVSHAQIAAEAADFMGRTTRVETYALWSIASGLVHSQPFYLNNVSDGVRYVSDSESFFDRQVSAFNLVRFLEVIDIALVSSIELFNARQIEHLEHSDNLG